MISQDQSDELKSHISKVRAADDLATRFGYGHTNKSAEEVRQEFNDAATGLDNFIASITEKQMNNVMYPEDEPVFKLKATVQTYELSIPDLQKIFAKELGVPESRVTVTAREKDVSGRMDAHSTYAFDGVIVTVKN